MGNFSRTSRGVGAQPTHVGASRYTYGVPVTRLSQRCQTVQVPVPRTGRLAFGLTAYELELERAGRYSRAEAEAIERDANRYRSTIYEWALPLAEAEELARRTLDYRELLRRAVTDISRRAGRA